MLDPAKLNLAKQAAEHPLDITTASELARAAKAWRRAPVLGVDTEFIRERTYYADLALIQVSDGQSVWLIDPLAIDQLDPFVEMLRNTAIIKVLHSPSEDLELLQHLFSTLPQPMFDSQIAATAVGQDMQMSYSRLVEWLLGEELDSSSTRSNWLRRPLSSAQRHYASLDVAYLPLLHELLSEKLRSTGRFDWHAEDSQRMCNVAAMEPNPADMYLRIREAHRLDEQQLNVLQQLAAWRDTRARAINRPRKHVLSDRSMLDIARALPNKRNDLDAIADLHPNFIDRQGKRVLQMVSDGINAETAAPGPPNPLSNSERKICAKLQEIVVNKAADLGVEPTWLVTRRDLDALIRSNGRIPGNGKLSGWRKAEIIDDLLTVINGDGQ
jgi:ribonuclease D